MNKVWCKALVALLFGTALELCVFNYQATMSLFTQGDVAYQINWFRIFIIPFIYLMGSFLFSFQKMPDYQAFLPKDKQQDTEQNKKPII